MTSTIAEVSQVISSIGGGRGVVATTDIESGSLIVLEWPFITWKQFNFDENEVLLAMVEQILLDPKAHEVSRNLHPIELAQIDNKEREMIQLQFQQGNLMERAAALDQPIEEIYRLLLVLKHNAFSSGLYHQLCMINHSCQPNCIKFEPRSASRGASEVWSIRPIKQGEEITISYVTPMEQTTPKTRDYLFDQHYFHCECVRCQQFQSFSQAISSSSAEGSDGKGRAEEDLEDYSNMLTKLEKEIEEKERELQSFLEAQASSAFVVSSEEDEQLQTLYQHFDQLASHLQALKHSVASKLTALKPTDVKFDENLYRIESRILSSRCQLHLFQIEATIIPHYQSMKQTKTKTMKGILSTQHQQIFVAYLIDLNHLYLTQMQYYESEDHPLISTILTDYLHAIEYLQFFCEDEFILQTIQTAIGQSIEESKEFGAVIPNLLQQITTEDNKKLSDIIKQLKKETSRCKALYLLAGRCKAAIFVKKEAGGCFWGQKTNPASL